MSEIPADIKAQAERAEEALNAVLAPLGTNLKHYMPVHKVAAIEAMVGVLAKERDRCATVAENWRPFPKPTSRAAMYWLMHCAIPNIAASIRNTNGESA